MADATPYLAKELPKGWEVVTVGDVAKDISSGFPSGEHNQEGRGVPHLRPMNVSPKGEIALDVVKYVESEDYDALEEGDVLFNNTNSPTWVGKTAYVRQDTTWAYSNHMTRVRPKDDVVYSGWLAHALHHIFETGFFRLHCRNHVNQASINTTFLSDVKFPLPPLSEQKRIVAEIEKQFTRLDAAVAGLKRIQANLERYKASVLKAACEGRLVPQEADLDPDYEPAEKLLARILEERRRQWEVQEWEKLVERAKKKVAQARRKAAGRPYYIRDLEPDDWEGVPEEAYRDYLPKSDKWKQKYEEPEGPDTEDLPELPEGWVWATIGYLFDVKVGSTPSRREERYWNGDIPWVSSGEVAFNRIRQTEELISRAGLHNSSVTLNPPGTVLLAMIGEGKTRGQAAILEISATNNQNAAAILCADSPVPSEWVFYWLMARYEETRRAGSGGMQPALNSRLVRAIPIPIPPENEMSRIVAEIEEDVSVIESAERSVAVNRMRANNLRQSILEQAFSGKLVPQDPDDEPAAALLARMRGDGKARAVAQPHLPFEPE